LEGIREERIERIGEIRRMEGEIRENRGRERIREGRIQISFINCIL